MRNINSINKRAADIKFYSTAWGSNGTSSLVITDQDGTILGLIKEVLFAPTLKDTPFGDQYVTDSDAVWLSEADYIDDDYKVWHLNYKEVMQCIAVSPVQSYIDVLRKIVKVVKK